MFIVLSPAGKQDARILVNTDRIIAVSPDEPGSKVMLDDGSNTWVKDDFMNLVGRLCGGTVPNETRGPLGEPVSIAAARADRTAPAGGPKADTDLCPDGVMVSAMEVTPFGFVVGMKLYLEPFPPTAGGAFTRLSAREHAREAVSRCYEAVAGAVETNLMDRFMKGQPVYGSPEAEKRRNAFFKGLGVSDETRCRLHTNCVKENGHHGPHQDANGEQWTNLMEGME